MKTSYFSKSGNLPNAISIARGSPTWFNGNIYLPLAPSWDLIRTYKQNKNEQKYVERYEQEVLKQLDPIKVYNELGQNAILLCWEKSKDFCHRHLVAKWFQDNLKIEITEL